MSDLGRVKERQDSVSMGEEQGLGPKERGCWGRGGLEDKWGTPKKSWTGIG